VLKDKTIFIAHNWSEAALNKQSVELAKYFSANNKVFFLNAKKRGLPFEKINENLTVIEWPGKRPVNFKDFVFAFRLMKKHKPYLLVSNFAANDIMMIAGKLTAVKIRISYFHTLVAQHISDFGKLDFRQQINIFRKGFAFRAATTMIASSNAGKKELIKYYKIKEPQIVVFPNSITDKRIINIPESIEKIGFVGRLHVSKGIDILINALKKVAEVFPQIRLIIIGKGPEEIKLKKQVEECRLQNNITFVNGISYDKVFQFLASINFLIVPSRIDNLPTVVMEAFSTGTPVIGSNSGGIPDMIDDGYNGLLFEKENADDLAGKILNLLKNTEQRNLFSKNARKTFEKKFSVENHPERFEAMLSLCSILK
jgi:glycosyltransferase involved in cell wall biosynthesis